MSDFVNPFKENVVPDEGPVVPRRKKVISKRTRVFLLVGSVALGILLLGALVGAKPTYRAFKHWRSTKLLAEAQVHLDAEEYVLAVGRARAAYVLYPDELPMRFLAKLFSSIGSDQCLDYWQRIVEIGGGLRPDRIELITSALRYNRVELATTQCDLLLAQPDPPVDDLLLAARVARERNDSQRELALLREANAKYPADAQVRFDLNRVLFRKGESGDAHKALEAILFDIHRPNKVGLDALNFVMRLPVSFFPDRLRLATLLRTNPLSSAVELVQAADIEVRADPSRRDAIVNDLMKDVQSRGSRAILTMADWLVFNLDFQSVAKLVTKENSAGDFFLHVIRADALSWLGRSEELEDVLQDTQEAVPPELAAFFRWQLAFRADPNSANEKLVREAIDKSAENPQAQVFMAPRFEKLRRDDLASQVYARLRMKPAFEASSVESLNRISIRSRDTASMARLAAELADKSGSTADQQNRKIYLQLLLNQSVQTNKGLAATMLAASPDRVVYMATLALAHLRVGDFAPAVRLFESAKDFDWKKASPTVRCVYVAVLFSAGRDSETAPIIQSLIGSVLLPEEIHLLEKNQ